MESRRVGKAGDSKYSMPRLFYKAIIVLLFTIIAIALFALEVGIYSWLVDKYPNSLAWTAVIVLGVIDIPILFWMLNNASKHIKRA